ncbi:hypothetical protein A8C56_06680 [Niabella ginsenosidivorans]|uniref:Uncharacterized protein n=1 Tax=Niabella ginsenosidivorans TaxID=1176587 RepID=A0A1A9HZK6_9BACT|nr:hypothetical protein [Niabella ginsenosidivorans]ANH80703.1 hypothetical protein A8C56_06680 [Niabella ginsenosidivorans]
MNNFINAITEAVLPAKYHASSVFEMETLAEEHPYSAALQLLLAARLHEANDPSLKKQWQKTLLYFKDPLFLQYQFYAKNNEIRKTGEPAAHNSHEAEVVDHKIETTPLPAIIASGTPQQAPLPAASGTTDIPGIKLEPLDAAKADLLFTPYYTVDYFAAQGIKLNDDANASDRFGTQLKSFTSWLKEMRRLPDATTGIRLSSKGAAEIEKMAEQSLSGKNEETAAMAEVWAKQGNKDKAIEIYQKLSLQNPSKRAYFAAKIEHLKK